MSQQAGKIVAAWGPSTVGTEGEEKEEVDLGCSFVGVKNQNKCFFSFTSCVAGIVSFFFILLYYLPTFFIVCCYHFLPIMLNIICI